MTVYRSHRRRRPLLAIARIFGGFVVLLGSGLLLAFVLPHGVAIAIIIITLWVGLAVAMLHGIRGRR